MKQLTALIFLALLAGACTPRPASDPAAAKVNGKSISIAQFRQALARLDRRTASPSAPALLLERMINTELFAQQAEKLKLDRSAPVAAAIDAARGNVLAQAYLEHAAGWTPGDKEEVRAFYRENFALFAGRRVYRLFEIAVAAPEPTVHSLRQRAAQASGLYEVAAWLAAQNVPFNVGGATKPAEHIAPGLLTRIAKMRNGEIAVIAVPGGASIVQLVQSESAPVSQEEATVTIEEMLRARRRAAVAKREMAFLRSKAAVEYLVDLGQQRSAARAAKPDP